MRDPCTCCECNAKQNRIAAFAAIRRAAEVARWNDATQAGNNPMSVVGDRIRDAIRAAIGSDKS